MLGRSVAFRLIAVIWQQLWKQTRIKTERMFDPTSCKRWTPEYHWANPGYRKDHLRVDEIFDAWKQCGIGDSREIVGWLLLQQVNTNRHRQNRSDGCSSCRPSPLCSWSQSSCRKLTTQMVSRTLIVTCLSSKRHNVVGHPFHHLPSCSEPESRRDWHQHVRVKLRLIYYHSGFLLVEIW
jgi:hypothetical protein